MEDVIREYYSQYLKLFDDLLIFKGVKKDPFVAALIGYLSESERTGGYSLALRAELVYTMAEMAEDYGFSGNIFKKLMIRAFLEDENLFSLAVSRGENNKKSSIYLAAKKEAVVLTELLSADLPMFMNVEVHQSVAGYYVPMSPEEDPSGIAAYAEEMENAPKPEAILEMLEMAYLEFGAGALAWGRMFRVGEHGELVRIRDFDRSAVSDIIGCEAQKKALLRNTEAFLAGRAANNVLLAGARGTGKSTLVKALANEYGDRGLRLIELAKGQLRLLAPLISELKRTGSRCVIFMDDLSFDDDEREYKYLKSILEGGAEARPKNVLFYATSNRRRIVVEKWADRDGEPESDEVHTTDTQNEKLSLADRFGLTIFFPKPSPGEYIDIVSGLAKKAGLVIDESFLEKAGRQWELSQKGISGRSARQFVEQLGIPGGE